MSFLEASDGLVNMFGATHHRCFCLTEDLEVSCFQFANTQIYWALESLGLSNQTSEVTSLSVFLFFFLIATYILVHNPLLTQFMYICRVFVAVSSPVLKYLEHSKRSYGMNRRSPIITEHHVSFGSFGTYSRNSRSPRGVMSIINIPYAIFCLLHVHLLFGMPRWENIFYLFYFHFLSQTQWVGIYLSSTPEHAKRHFFGAARVLQALIRCSSEASPHLRHPLRGLRAYYFHPFAPLRLLFISTYPLPVIPSLIHVSYHT
jgi:hypothetical protein